MKKKKRKKISRKRVRAALSFLKFPADVLRKDASGVMRGEYLNVC